MASGEQSGHDYLARFILTSEPDLPESAPKSSGRGRLRLEFEDDQVVEASSDRTILECALEAGVGLTHVCGGQAKCSTCRVLILDGLANVLPRNRREARLAAAKGFSRDVRLACQSRARGTVRLRRLVLDEVDIDVAISQGSDGGGAVGQEASLAVLFSDIRAFTAFAEHTLAYDLVHILNRYYESVGCIADRNGGYIDKYLGDGIMILFGLDSLSRSNPSGFAIRTGLQMLENLVDFNRYLADRFEHEFRIGIGICTGRAVVGSFGFHKKREYTAIGDTVNTASRIEALTKVAGHPLLVCPNTFAATESDFRWGDQFEANLRGKQAAVTVHRPLAAIGD